MLDYLSYIIVTGIDIDIDKVVTKLSLQGRVTSILVVAVIPTSFLLIQSPKVPKPLSTSHNISADIELKQTKTSKLNLQFEVNKKENVLPIENLVINY